MILPLSLLLPLHCQPALVPSNLIIRVGTRKYSHHCLQDRYVIKCQAKENMSGCVTKNLLECLFNDPLHPKDYPTNLKYLKEK